MNFNSFEYAAFFACVLLLFWSLRGRIRIWILLGASYLFYATLDWRFLGLLLLSTAVDFTVAGAIHHSSSIRQRQRWLLVSLLCHLGILAYFKYAGFFLEGFQDMLGALGISPSEVTLEIALPVGVSFYTFQSMSYTIDVYRGKLTPTRDPVVYATFVAFFPQLLAGPIERAGNLLPQLGALRTRLRSVEVREGLDLILLGLFKKVAVADVMGRVVVDVFGGAQRFEHGILVLPNTPSGAALALASVGLALQIYLDFSGYSDIARGSAKLLGVDISRNFLRPFWATNYRELWRRWHVTLMDWFRDYVYIPLGGNRKGVARGYVNLIAVFGLSGLWHGATAGFVVWGILNGIAIAVETAVASRRTSARVPPTAGRTPVGVGATSAHRSSPRAEPSHAVRPAFPAAPTEPRAWSPGWPARVGGRLYVCLLFVVLMVPLGTTSLGATVDVWTGILTLQAGTFDAADLALVLYAVAMTALSDRRQRFLDRVEDARRAAEAHRQEPVWQWGAISAALVLGVVVFSGQPLEPFFYFQF